MGRRNRGVRIAPLTPFLLLFALVAGCTPVRPTPSPSAAEPTAAEPTASPRLPTPVPTDPASAAPTPSEAAPPTGLVVRLTTCSHTCGPTPGTTVLDDGRIIWEDIENRATESQLTPEALKRVMDALAVPELDTDDDYQAELRPGAEPVGRGATLHRLEVVRGERRVVVTFGDPASYADEPDLWIIPPEMTVLGAIANELQDPVAWLGQASFTEDPQPYEPDRYLVVIDLFPDVGEDLGFDADVDAVDWPFGGPIEGAGEPVEAAGGFGSRCLVITAEEADAVIAAEAVAGAHRRQRLWLSTVEYRWRRADGFVQVSILPVLPYEQGSCVDLAAGVF
jgi:hypothetical protein